MKRRELLTMAGAGALLTLGACGKAVPYLDRAPTEAAPAEGRVRLRIPSLLVRDVVLPAYATDPAIRLAGPDGALVALGKAVWADESAQAVSQTLASRLAARSTAQVAAEPWPLATLPEAEVAVRFERFVAQSTPGGAATEGAAPASFLASGQIALAFPSGRARERIQPFALYIALPETTPQALANARAQAIEAVATEILRALS